MITVDGKQITFGFKSLHLNKKNQLIVDLEIPKDTSEYAKEKLEEYFEYKIKDICKE